MDTETKIRLANKWSHYRTAYMRLQSPTPPPGQVSSFNALVAGIMADIQTDIPMLMKEIASLEKAIETEARKAAIKAISDVIARLEIGESEAKEVGYKSAAQILEAFRKGVEEDRADREKALKKLEEFDEQDAPEELGKTDGRDDL